MKQLVEDPNNLDSYWVVNAHDNDGIVTARIPGYGRVEIDTVTWRIKGVEYPRRIVYVRESGDTSGCIQCRHQ